MERSSFPNRPPGHLLSSLAFSWVTRRAGLYGAPRIPRNGFHTAKRHAARIEISGVRLVFVLYLFSELISVYLRCEHRLGDTQYLLSCCFLHLLHLGLFMEFSDLAWGKFVEFNQ